MRNLLVCIMLSLMPAVYAQQSASAGSPGGERGESADAGVATVSRQSAGGVREVFGGIALRSNLLYDAALIPNIGAEVLLFRDWTVGVNWQCAWWGSDSSHRFRRIAGGDIDFRRYWSRRLADGTPLPLSGHHAGLYAQMLRYDIAFGGKGEKSDGYSFGAGIAYGYTIPAGSSLRFDFTIGIGFLRGDYMKYHPEDNCYVWDSTHTRTWIGPTKAEISLVYLFGARKKGGGR